MVNKDIEKKFESVDEFLTELNDLMRDQNRSTGGADRVYSISADFEKIKSSYEELEEEVAKKDDEIDRLTDMCEELQGH